MLLKDLNWVGISSSDETLYIGVSTALDGALEHADNIIAEDVLSNTLPMSKVSGTPGLMNDTAKEGIAVNKTNYLRLRISRSRLTAAGCTEDVDGFKQWAEANNAGLVYRLASPVSEHVILKALTAKAGSVALTGGYRGGTMTAQ